ETKISPCQAQPPRQPHLILPLPLSFHFPPHLILQCYKLSQLPASCGATPSPPSTFSTTHAVPYAHVCANPPKSDASNLKQIIALPPLCLHSLTTLPSASFRQLYSIVVNHRSSPPASDLITMPRLAAMLRERTERP
ncbi:uncharacterized protein CLUP02_11838, partial [Colletotrichum lupini]